LTDAVGVGKDEFYPRLRSMQFHDDTKRKNYEIFGLYQDILGGI